MGVLCGFDGLRALRWLTKACDGRDCEPRTLQALLRYFAVCVSAS